MLFHHQTIIIQCRKSTRDRLYNFLTFPPGFNSVEEVIDVVTVIISTCSLGHAAANFQQYEQYGFVPNYPGILLSEVPKEKVTSLKSA